MTTSIDRRVLGDPARMRVLASIDFDNPELRRALDRISVRTAQRTGLPVSLVTLVLNTAQMTVGVSGLDNWVTEADGTPIEWSFCANAVISGHPYVIPDAVHSEQAGNPLVTQDRIGSYAGVPVTLGGQIVGAHCIIGPTAHLFTTLQLAELEQAANEIAALFQQFSDLD
ncbi:hypothetical protein Q0Z83_012290 [Actinoplanes sichuanensis]|uniref:GAF domain-containing protein n=1 Tax=Actinoplanes sichuanensis TaxID=512349 RepID=A0ABW4A695_9ACTN|nr:GAF domain-containing protein [Actinoplanes sichuanensis]BEL03038.1 hypothetical protein Q0Z83_012290 [Actinoplanes sichuanensis]